MGVAWNPLGLAGVSAGALALAMAIVVGRARSAAGANRRLALILAVEGIAAFTGTGLVYFVDDRASALSIQLFATAASLALPSLYLLLLATLPTPAVRPWRGAPGLWAAVALVIGLEAILLARPSAFVADMEPTWYAAQEAVPGALAWVPATLLLAVSIYGLVAALLAHRASPPATIRRMRSRAYARAFGARDLLLALVLLAPTVGAAIAPGRAWDLFPVLGFPIALFAYVPLLAYGILRTQLFDVELRLKGSVQRAVVFASFIVAYVLVSQLATALLTPRAGTALGVVAAGALAFAILPLDRAAARVADAVMPRVRDEERYLAARRLEVYRAALEDTSPSTRADANALRELRARLGVTEAEHALLTELVDRPRAQASAPLVVSRYSPIRPLGEGASGATILARDELLGREVALKHVVGGAREALAEARTLALVHDPRVVTIHDALREGDDAWIVMEYVAGGSLKDRLADGPLRGDEFTRIARDLLSSLDTLHALGIVHRDVKPANVLLTERGSAKLGDFGLAGALARTRAATQRYASPEQRAGAATSPASDLWSAAATLREAAPDAMRTSLAAWFDRAMAERPDERFASARDALAALEGALTPPRTREESARR